MNARILVLLVLTLCFTCGAPTSARGGMLFRLTAQLSTVCSTEIEGSPVAVVAVRFNRVVIATSENVLYLISNNCKIIDSFELPAGENPVAMTANKFGQIYIARKDGRLHSVDVIGDLNVKNTGKIDGKPVAITAGANSVFIATNDGKIHECHQNLLHPTFSFSFSGTPAAIALAGPDELYTATLEGQVYRFTRSFPPNPVVARGVVSGRPVDITVPRDGIIAIATDNGSLYLFAKDGSQKERAMIGGKLVGAVRDHRGNLFVARDDGEIISLYPDMKKRGTISVKTSPTALTIDDNGENIYVVGE